MGRWIVRVAGVCFATERGHDIINPTQRGLGLGSSHNPLQACCQSPQRRGRAPRNWWAGPTQRPTLALPTDALVEVPAVTCAARNDNLPRSTGTCRCPVVEPPVVPLTRVLGTGTSLFVVLCRMKLPGPASESAPAISLAGARILRQQPSQPTATT